MKKDNQVIYDDNPEETVTITVSGDDYKREASLTSPNGLKVSEVNDWLPAAFEAVGLTQIRDDLESSGS